MLSQLVYRLNLFPTQQFWNNSHTRELNNPFPAILSLPIAILIFILFLLQFIQFVTHGIVFTSSQVNFSYQPPFSTFTTKNNDPAYSPFMIAFTLTNQNTCPNTAITYDVNINIANGVYNSSNRTLRKIPINLEACNSSHFAMLPSGLSKLQQYTSKALYCLPLDNYYEVGGANSLSSFYKNLKFNFTCPASCSSPCGKAEFFVVNSQPNLYNNSDLFSYSLRRKLFTIQKNPAFLISYPLISTNVTTDSSLLPFSTKNTIRSIAAGDAVTDMIATSGDYSTTIVFESADQSVLLQRSYYKLFDLLAYMGGIIYGIFALFSFVDSISRLEFQMKFAAEYFRNRETKSYNFAGFMKQIIFDLLKNTRWKPDWRIVQAREQLKETITKVLDVIYLNKRILFLQEAISLLFEPHQLKGIYLLHSLTPQEIQSRINNHRFRDRTIYYLNKNVEPQESHPSLKGFQHKRGVQVQSKEGKQNGKMIQEVQIYASSDHNFVRQEISLKEGMGEIKFEVANSIEDENNNLAGGRRRIYNGAKRELRGDSSVSQIVNQAEQFYKQAQSQSQRFSQGANMRELEKEMQYVGELPLEEFQQEQLQYELETQIKRLIMEGEQPQGDGRSRKICDRLDGWLKNELKALLRRR